MASEKLLRTQTSKGFHPNDFGKWRYSAEDGHNLHMVFGCSCVEFVRIIRHCLYVFTCWIHVGDLYMFGFLFACMFTFWPQLRAQNPSIVTKVELSSKFLEQFWSWKTLIPSICPKKSSLGNIHMGQIPPLNVSSPQAYHLLSSASIHAATRYEYWCWFRHTCSFPSADVVKAVRAMIPPSLTQQFNNSNKQDLFQAQVWKSGVKAQTKNSSMQKREHLDKPSFEFQKTDFKNVVGEQVDAGLILKQNDIPHHRCKSSLKQKRDMNYVHYSLGPAFALISK